MASTPDAIARIAVTIARTLGKSAPFFQDFSLEVLGIQLPFNPLDQPAVKTALQQGKAAAEGLDTAADELKAATETATPDVVKIIKAVYALSTKLVAYFTAIANVIAALKTAIGTIGNAADKNAALAFADGLTRKIVNTILAVAIEEAQPYVLYLLKIIGLADWRRSLPSAGNLGRSFVEKELHLERLKDFVADPAKHFRDTVKWGSNDFDPAGSFELLKQLFSKEAAVVTGKEGADAFFKWGSHFRISRATSFGTPPVAISPPGLLFTFMAAYNASEEKRIKFNDYWGASFSARFGISGELNLLITPPLNIDLKPPAGQTEGEIKAFIDRNSDKRPINVLGSNGLVTLTVENIAVGAGLSVIWDAAKNAAQAEPLFFADLKAAKLRIGSADADGFIGKLLAAADIEANFDLGIEYLASKGLRVKASGGFEIALPIHKLLGLLEIDTIFLGLRIQEDATLSLETSAGFKALLGPLSATVERMGAKLDLKFAGDGKGKFGFFDAAFGFKPPTGVGLALDAGVIKGGGYLSFEYEKGQYSGALEFDFSGVVALKAIGIINTKLPDGKPGFALLIIITAEFGAGFQLGFGFVLLGVGGLLAVNRRMSLEPLAEGVRTGATTGIMFPTNIVENAPRIISDLQRFFPIEEGKFLIGPMAKLGWGTPALISVTLGIIIEIPGNIAILGIVKVALPTEDAPLLVLQINFIGAIEFDKKRLWFFASLYESRILFITIEGEAGLLIAWGDDANFVVSVGGFHPSFTPPPLPFPSPARIALCILNESWGKIRVTAYFAVTSNTVQFGAGVELYFGFSALKIEGHIQFDALFQFSPFYFIIEVSASFSVKVFGIGLFSVRVRMSLEGPAPYRAKGTGSISLLFFDVDVDFDITWGEDRKATLPSIDILPRLRQDLEKADAWKALLPEANNLFVTLRKLEDGAGLVLHPSGLLQITQRFAPLGLRLDKIGSQPAGDVTSATITAVSDGMEVATDVRESFAMAQYQEYSNAEKLSLPSFQKEKSGIVLRAAGVAMGFGKAVKRNVRYELIVIDSTFRVRISRFFRFFSTRMFSHFLKGNAVAKASVSFKTRNQLNTMAEKIVATGGSYYVADIMNNKAHGASAAFGTEAEARGFMQQQVKANPRMAASLHVIPLQELNQQP